MESNPLILIIRTLGELYVFILLMRLVLQAVKADYYNPISQGVVRFTQPAVKPFQSILPKVMSIDSSPFVVAIIVKLLTLYGIYAIAGHLLPITSVLFYAFIGTINTFLDIIFYAMIGSVIMSWIGPDSPHPAPQLIMQVTAPIYRLMQRVLPPIGGFDLSPIVVIITIQLIQSQLRPFLI